MAKIKIQNSLQFIFSVTAILILQNNNMFMQLLADSYYLLLLGNGYFM